MTSRPIQLDRCTLTNRLVKTCIRDGRFITPHIIFSPKDFVFMNELSI